MSSVIQSLGDSWALWVAAALSLATAAVYLVIASPAAPEGYKAPPRAVVVVAAVAYLVGGGLILVADSRLLAVGAVLNPLVVTAYVAAAVNGRATVDRLSLAGKAAQVALEVLLLWLVA